jgi:hypothetical protein
METHYLSVLETQWGVFFDELDIQWKYTTKGDISGFWLPMKQWFVVIQDEYPTSESQIWQQAATLAVAEETSVLIFAGPIGFKRGQEITQESITHRIVRFNLDGSISEDCYITQCRYCDLTYCTREGLRGYTHVHTIHGVRTPGIHGSTMPRLIMAYAMAMAS